MNGKTFAGLAAIAICLGLGGCDASSATRSASDDGDYKGSSTRVQAMRRDCPHPRPMILPVRAGTMFYRWSLEDIQVSLLGNGTLAGASGNTRVSGTHDGTTIQGDISDGQCTLHFTLRKVS